MVPLHTKYTQNVCIWPQNVFLCAIVNMKNRFFHARETEVGGIGVYSGVGAASARVWNIIIESAPLRTTYTGIDCSDHRHSKGGHCWATINPISSWLYSWNIWYTYCWIFDWQTFDKSAWLPSGPRAVSARGPKERVCHTMQYVLNRSDNNPIRRMLVIRETTTSVLMKSA